MNSFLFFFFLSFISLVNASTQTELCSHLVSPVTFKIPTFQQLAPLGNNNGIVGQAKWGFDTVGSFNTRNNITFNACMVDDSSYLLPYVTDVKFIVNRDQILDYSATRPILNKYMFNSSWSLNCIGGNIEIDANIPSVTIDQLVTLSLLDDRHAAYAVYFINGVEGLVGYNSTVPPMPVLLPALDLTATGID
jgi:hypothetical protein